MNWSEMDDCPVTEEHIRFYKENGYVQFKDFFSRDEVGHLRDALNHSVEHNRERILGGKGQMSEDYNIPDWPNPPGGFPGPGT